MKSTRWFFVCAVAFALATSSVSFAQGHGNGNGHNKHDRDDDDDDHGRHGDRDRDRHDYNDHDRDAVRDWYRYHRDNLPPGLAKRDRLPPGLERQLEARGTLPPGLRKKIYYVPQDLAERLPPPPPDCRHAFIGGHVVLVNVRTFNVLAVVHLDF
jgi:hypothetical protein